MHILFLTWKDPKHPHAGGAEKVMYEYAKGLIQKGHSVTWFASHFRDAKDEIELDGIRVIRAYSVNTIWLFAWRWYREFQKKNTIDVVIDEAGGWPMLAPLYVRGKPLSFFVHHVGDREFDYNTDFGIFSRPVRTLAKWVYLTLFRFYKSTKVITVSPSTRDELVDRFCYKKDNIHVIGNTTNLHPIEDIDFEKRNHDFVFLGRLTPIKRPDHAIKALSSVVDRLPSDAKLHIIGNAQDQIYVATIHKLINDLALDGKIVFHGFMSPEKFGKILSESVALIVPSEKEGYGLIVLEANAYGLPALAYDVAGLRDSVVSGKNGILVENGDYEALGEEMVNIFGNKEKYRTLCQSSLQMAKNHPNWETQKEIFCSLIIPKR